MASGVLFVSAFGGESLPEFSVFGSTLDSASLCVVNAEGGSGKSSDKSFATSARTVCSASTGSFLMFSSVHLLYCSIVCSSAFCDS